MYSLKDFCSFNHQIYKADFLIWKYTFLTELKLPSEKFCHEQKYYSIYAVDFMLIGVKLLLFC